MKCVYNQEPCCVVVGLGWGFVNQQELFLTKVDNTCVIIVDVSLWQRLFIEEKYWTKCISIEPQVVKHPHGMRWFEYLKAQFLIQGDQNVFRVEMQFDNVCSSRKSTEPNVLVLIQGLINTNML